MKSGVHDPYYGPPRRAVETGCHNQGCTIDKKHNGGCRSTLRIDPIIARMNDRDEAAQMVRRFLHELSTYRRPNLEREVLAVLRDVVAYDAEASP